MNNRSEENVFLQGWHKRTYTTSKDTGKKESEWGVCQKCGKRTSHNKPYCYSHINFTPQVKELHWRIFQQEEPSFSPQYYQTA